MAVVVDPKDVKQFPDYAKEENLEAIPVAVVTKSPRLVMSWRGNTTLTYPEHSLIPTVRTGKQRFGMFRTEKEMSWTAEESGDEKTLDGHTG
ncbi:MAG: hypothetical protein ACLRMZ_08975 [Blautia marasmi]